MISFRTILRAAQRVAAWFAGSAGIARFRDSPVRGVAACALVCVLAQAACMPLAGPSRPPDGDYRGSSTRVQALRRDCPHPTPIITNVRSNTLFYRWGNQYIQTSVQTNGAVSGALPGVQLTGRYDGTTIQGDITDGQCILHFTLTRTSP